MNPKKLMVEIMAMLEMDHKALSREYTIYDVTKAFSGKETLERRIIKIDGKEFLIEVSEIK